MENMCASCPNRAMANLNRSLGNEDEAKRIESLGCQWWWGINYTNDETRVTKLVYDCGVPHLARIIMDQGAKVEEAAQSIQTTRNEIAYGFQRLSTIPSGLLGLSETIALSTKPEGKD